ncbi:hypothetical protein AVEN_43048-1 [Araneus ventricosus]|uniref:Uncharacterized protein n=1 Tax=Araneus ventricosus TaxID=182803 RepID=A0A4Y2H329_ARAVE|nr:hypothetical protein AVEN_43048-1 [Araneus ventricosus]
MLWRVTGPLPDSTKDPPRMFALCAFNPLELCFFKGVKAFTKECRFTSLDHNSKLRGLFLSIPRVSAKRDSIKATPNLVRLEKLHSESNCNITRAWFGFLSNAPKLGNKLSSISGTRHVLRGILRKNLIPVAI